MGKRAEVVIVGAGIMGLAVGWRLAQQGRHVVICEREVAGFGASTAAAGMLAPTAEVRYEEEALLRLGQRSAALYPEFVAELEEASGLSVDYEACGTLVVGLDRDDTEALDHLLAYQQRLGLPATLLSGDAAREREPSLSPNVHSAVWCPDDHRVDPTRLVAALAAAFTRAGGILREHTPVAEITTRGDQIAGVVLDTGTSPAEYLAADHVVLCAGAWTRKLKGVDKKLLPHIRPVRGQMLALETPEPLCTHVVRSPDAYLVPRKSDPVARLIIGATSEEMGFDPRMTAGGVFELLRGAWEAMPGVYDLPLIDMWTGFRPVALANEPVIGPSRDLKNLWFVTGHGRNGILLTPITAALFADSFS